jgi:sporulation protein YlmC with PRC-barrel domain
MRWTGSSGSALVTIYHHVEKEQTMLIKLSNTNLRVAEPSQDLRGHRVMDKDGRDLGEVDDLILDRVEKKVRFIEVASGDLFGFGQAKALIPVDAITRISDQVVYINQTSQHVAAGPRYDPDLIVQETGNEGSIGDIYRHYGLLPYWQPGYVYPPHQISTDTGSKC